MGYRGKVAEQRRARELRARSWTLQEIADELGVSKGSVSVWVRDVDFEPRPRNRGHPAGPHHPMRRRKEAELAAARVDAEQRIGTVSDRDLLVFGAALYLGEGAKTERSAVRMTNTSPDVIRLHLAWLRALFAIDESRLRARLYLHDDLDIDAATNYWSSLTGIPPVQFQRPYRPVRRSGADSKHPMGCLTVIYSCLLTHRRVMALIEAISSRVDTPG